MLGPRFTLRQIAIAIAVIGILLAFWVQNPLQSAYLTTALIPVAFGFSIAALARRGMERTSAYWIRNPDILLILILAAIGVASLAVTILIPDPHASEFFAFGLAIVFSIPTLLGFVIYQVSQRSLRFRLTVEILTLIALLAFSAWTWQPRPLLQAAERADAMAAKISEWAERPNAPKNRDAIRRESEWFRRRAFSLRCQAIWYGLIHGSHGYVEYYSYDTATLVHELGILEAMDAHEMRARQEHEGQNARNGP